MVLVKGKVLGSSVDIFKRFSGSEGVRCDFKRLFSKFIVPAIINKIFS